MNEFMQDIFKELRRNIDIDFNIQEKSRKVFVNRNLKMKKIKMIGFDMDYTLAPYKKQEIESLQYKMVQDRLVEFLGFPKEILKYEYLSDFVVLGLFLDLKTGHLLKIDRYNFVIKGYHGLKKISDEELKNIYRNNNTPLNLYDDFVRIDTLFSLPETSLFSQIVEEFPIGSFYDSYKELYENIRKMTDTIHRDTSLKNEIISNLPKYIKKTIDLPLTLHNFKSDGKKLFLLTNSYYEYTDKVMSYLLDGELNEYQSWRDYFDLIIVGSQKPLFFSTGAELIKLSSKGKVIKKQETKTKIFQGGNLEHLETFTELKGENILYVGDHIYGDILKVKKTSLWRTCLIVEDLEDEIAINEENKDMIKTLMRYDQKINILDSALNYQKMMVKSLKKSISPESTTTRSSLERKVLSELIDKSEENISKINKLLIDNIREYHILNNTLNKRYNKYWGMVFKEDKEKTKFSDQLESFACLYTSRVTNFLFYSPKQYFRSPMEVMPHEM
jgi:HAD superfamily 5'-nucleotidase-like hydrolase